MEAADLGSSFRSIILERLQRRNLICGQFESLFTSCMFMFHLFTYPTKALLGQHTARALLIVGGGFSGSTSNLQVGIGSFSSSIKAGTTLLYVQTRFEIRAIFLIPPFLCFVPPPGI